jgi:CRP/FNR family transcriptional regulator, anaerobic regulatory protein
MQTQAIVGAAKFDVAALAMCRGLDRGSVSHLVAISSLRRKASGETLFSEGDEANDVYEVVRGSLRLYKLLPDGRRQIMGFPSAGHLLGLAPEGTHVYTAEALNEVVLCRYPRASFHRLVDDVPKLARRMWAVTADELRFAQDQMLLLGRKTATEKVASFLMMLAGHQSTDTLSVPMTRADIGDYVGLTIETVSRTLTKLKRDKLIALPHSDTIEILDRDELEAIATGEAGDL